MMIFFERKEKGVELTPNQTGETIIGSVRPFVFLDCLSNGASDIADFV